MASPVAQTPVATPFSSASSSWAIPLPTGIQAGETLLIFARLGGAGGTITPPSGFTQLVSDTSDASDDVTLVYWKKATGSEGASVTLGMTSAQKGVAIAYRISGAVDPTTRAPQSALAVFTTAANAGNPPSLSPTGGSKDYLLVAFVGFDGTGTVTAAPSGYSGLVTSGSSGSTAATNARAAAAVRQATVATEDPGAFTHAAANSGGTAITVAVHPLVAAAVTVPLQSAPAASGATLAVGIPYRGVVDAYTVLMLHNDGPVGSSALVDASASAHAVVNPWEWPLENRPGAFGQWVHTTAGTGAGYLYVDDNLSDFHFGSGDFTLEARAALENLDGYAQFLLSFWWWYGVTGQSYGFQFDVNIGAGVLSFGWGTPGDATTDGRSVAWSPTINREYHFAVARAGNVLRFFVDGVQVGADQDMTGVVINDAAGRLLIGNEDPTYAQYPLRGWIDEVRVSKGIARWTSNFTPPIAPYEAAVVLGTLNPAVAASGATLAISVPAAVALNASAAVSGGTLALKAAPTVALATSSASSGATLALRAPALVPLSVAGAQSGATLALTATPKITGTAAAQSGATLTLTAQPKLTLSSAAVSGATLAVTIPSAAVTVPLASSAASSSATVALRATTTVPLASSSATSTATLALQAPTLVALGSSPCQSGATLTLTATPRLTLGVAAAQSTATLALTVPTRVPLASSSATSSATLALVATNVPTISGTSTATSGATLALTATTVPTIGAATAATSSGTLALTAPTRIVLGASPASSSSTLTLSVATKIPLGAAAAVSSSSLTVGTKLGLILASSAQSGATLAVSVAVSLQLDASSATSTSTLTLGAPALVGLGTATAQSGATLTTRTPVAIVLGVSAAVSTSTAAVAVPFAPPVGPLGVLEPVLATGVAAVLSLGAVAALSTGAYQAAWATGATGTSTSTGAAVPAGTGAVELVTP